MILGRNVLGYVSESYGFVNDSWLVSLAIRVVSLEIHGRNVLSLVVRGRNISCFGSDFAFRHVRIFREFIRDRVLSFVAHKLASELITENERKHCGTAGDIFGMVETETLILAPQAKILGI